MVLVKNVLGVDECIYYGIMLCDDVYGMCESTYGLSRCRMS